MATAAAVDLPDHLWQWQTVMRTKRRGKTPAHGIQISTGRKFTGLGGNLKQNKVHGKKGKQVRKVDFDKNCDSVLTPSNNGARAMSLASTHSSLSDTVTNGTNVKEKFNFVEEFFVCLACIFD